MRVMSTTPATLPDSVEELRALVLLQADRAAKYQAEIAEHEAVIAERETKIAAQAESLSAHTEEISELREYIRLLKAEHFGPSSERTAPDQLGLFNEAEVLGEDVGEGESNPAAVDIPGHTRRTRGGRRPLPDYLPREGEGDIVDVSGRELNWLLDGFDIFALKPHGELSYASVL